VFSFILIMIYVLGMFTGDTIKEYGSIAWHKWFKTEIMEETTGMQDHNGETIEGLSE